MGAKTNGSAAVALFAVILLVGPADANEAGLSGLHPPPAVPAPAGPVDPEAPWCTDAETPDRGPGGLLMRHAGLVLRLCKEEIEGSGPERMRVNDARIPGLIFDLYAGQVKMMDVKGELGTYENGLRIKFRTHTAHVPAPDESEQLDHLARHERHSGALYEVWQNPDPPIYDHDPPDPTASPPFLEIHGPSPYPYGNLYVFIPESGTAALPPHHVPYNAELMTRW